MIFNKHITSVTAPAAIAIAERVRELKANNVTIAALQSGEPCFSTPNYIVDAANQGLDKGLTTYSDSSGMIGLRKALAQYYSEQFSFEADFNQFIISQGASNAIFNILKTMINEGDQVLIPDPSWPQYNNMTLVAGGKPQRVSTYNDGYKLNINLLDQHINANTKLVVINNPNNPTGVVYTKSELEKLISYLGERKIYMLFDEVYDQIVYSDDFCKVFSTEVYKKYSEYVLYVNSFSKTFSMTGWRVGYAYLPKEARHHVLVLQQNSLTNTPGFIQYAAQIAIEEKQNNQDLFGHFLSVYKKRKEQIEGILTSKGIEFIKPEGAFYFFIRINQDGLEYCEKLLLDKKIATVPGGVYGDDFRQYYRMSFAVDENSYNMFIEWIKKK